MANLEHPTNREEAYLYGFIDSGFIVPEPITRKEAYLAEIVNDYQTQEKTDYVTPEQFGAKGDGTTDDVQALDDAISTGRVVYLTGRYYISRPINITSNTRIYGDKLSKRYDQPVDTTHIRSGGVFFHSDSTISNIQIFDIALWDTTAAGSGNKVFDCNLQRSDFRIQGYNIHTFSDSLQSCNFDHCYFLNTQGPFSISTSDSSIRDSYISGDKANQTTPFISGLMSAMTISGCYIDFWYNFANVNGYSINNLIIGNVFDACYHVFQGNYHFFGVFNNVFMRIKDSTLWTLGQSDWCVFCNGLRNYTRVMGNSCDGNYFIHTSLTGSSYPNKDSISCNNILVGSTAITWNPYPYDNTDLLKTRVEELNFKTYTTLPNASLTAGSAERFNHQFAFSGGNLYINNGGTWLQLS